MVGRQPHIQPGTDAGRVCPKALHDAEPTKHTQPFTGERGLGIGIINQKFISKIDFFYKLRAVPKHCPQTIHLKISIVELSHKLLDKLLNLVCGFLNGNFI